MISYIFIIMAVVCFTAQFAFTKSYEKIIPPSFSGSLVMVIVTNLVGALLFLTARGFSVSFSLISVFWAVILAVIMIPYFVIGVKVLTLGSLAVYSMFMMLGGMLVPFLYGVLFLNERLTVGRLAGTILLSVFVVMQALWSDPQGNRNTDKSKKRLFFILCLVIFFVNGMTGVIAKSHQISSGAVDEISFTVLSCTLTMLFALCLLLCRGKQTISAFKTAFHSKPLVIMMLLGAAAYTGSFLHLKAASDVPATVQFPLVSGGVIVLSALTSFFFFKEKISKKELLSVIGAFVSTLLFAF